MAAEMISQVAVRIMSRSRPGGREGRDKLFTNSEREWSVAVTSAICCARV